MPFSLVVVLLIASVDGFVRSPILSNPCLTQPLRKSSTSLHGIPKLFRWLVDLYPVVIESVGEGISSNNAMAVDNFYLDMNGIIHTCTHSNNDKLIALNEKEMFMRIFSYTDRLYKLVKPSQKMFLAVDGVAPRAKMNQQRARRFRSSKEREVLLSEYVAEKGKLPDAESFDSNCITPGTEFMYRLGIAFRRWIAYKMDTDPFWQSGATVVFSGPDVPGEGEHKVMDMVRADKKAAGAAWKPGQLRHCMYGLDADLIMLSLVTHEPFFVLLREKIKNRKQNKDAMTYSQEDFELLEVSILRKMLKQHFRNIGEKPRNRRIGDAVDAATNVYDELMKDARDGSEIEAYEPQEEGFSAGWSHTKFNLERIIDDFIFMCFFIGNDFLPCLPHLDIADGSLSLMMNIYKDLLPSLGGYLTDKDKMQLRRVELFVQEVARREPLYFQQRAIDEKDEEYATDSYKDHYYKVKFGIEPGDKESIRKVCRSYLEGLFWVLTYYHHGCESWTWYYPYLYAPLASDLVDLAQYDITFERGAPFTPLMQLLSVLPPQSSTMLPEPYKNLMIDPASPLVEFYPKDFEVDANGKKNSWECIVRIPFINEEKLVGAVCEIDHRSKLQEHERRRNIAGEEYTAQPTKPGLVDTRQRAGVDLVDKGGWGNALTDDRRGHHHTTPRKFSDQDRRPPFKRNSAGDKRR